MSAQPLFQPLGSPLVQSVFLQLGYKDALGHYFEDLTQIKITTPAACLFTVTVVLS